MIQRPEKPLPRSIAVVCMLRGLGDMLCVVPALRSLRLALPKARITLIGFAFAHTFVERFSHYIDELAECPGYPGIPERELCPRQLPEFLAAMQERRFDLAVQMHGNGVITNPFTVLLGARMNAGFFLPGQFCPDGDRFLPYVEKESEVLRYLRLMELLGLPARGSTLEFPLGKNDREELAALPQMCNLRPGAYVCIHPGAHDLSRCWPADRFTCVADALSGPGMPVVLTGNTAESALTRRISEQMKKRPVDLAGRIGLGALGVLLSNARLLICNDTGISHVAAALRVPSVVIFTNSDPDRWAPLDRDLHRAVSAGSARGNRAHCCVGTIAKNGAESCAVPEEWSPSVEDVLTAAGDLLLREKRC
jgi:ADP-heptose:LPS heptosyltransferase